LPGTADVLAETAIVPVPVVMLQVAMLNVVDQKVAGLTVDAQTARHHDVTSVTVVRKVTARKVRHHAAEIQGDMVVRKATDRADLRTWITDAVLGEAATLIVVLVAATQKMAGVFTSQVKAIENWLAETEAANISGLRCEGDGQRSHTVDPVQADHGGCSMDLPAAHRLVVARVSVITRRSVMAAPVSAITHRSVIEAQDGHPWDRRG